MLHYKTIDENTLGLLRELQRVDSFSDLRLVGGTALALQIGHRKSIDIDLFGSFDSDELEIAEILSEIGTVKIIKKSKKIFINIVNGIKVDIVNYKYPWIDEPLLIDSLFIASKVDIVAMKLGAITGRGSKKDFVDLYFLLHEFSLKQIFDFYDKKFKDGNRFLVIKSLTYFEDADREQMPVMFKNVDWETIKLFIKTSVSHFLNNEEVK